MSSISHLLARNRAWSRQIHEAEPDFFQRLTAQQNPKYLWIGCSDSRVPANEIVDLLPGELFVHRNVANVVVHTDLNCLSVLQYAVDVLHVEHVIVVGHYGCGGVRAARQGRPLGLIDNWLRHVQDVAERHASFLGGLPDEDTAVDRLCELNVLEQVGHVCAHDDRAGRVGAGAVADAARMGLRHRRRPRERLGARGRYAGQARLGPGGGARGDHAHRSLTRRRHVLA